MDHMITQGYITQTQYDEVINDDVYFSIRDAQIMNSDTENTVYTYFEDELIDQVINDLMNIEGYYKNRRHRIWYTVAV